MWEDDTRGGVRKVLLLSAAEGQVRVRVRARPKDRSARACHLAATVSYVML